MITYKYPKSELINELAGDDASEKYKDAVGAALRVFRDEPEEVRVLFEDAIRKGSFEDLKSWVLWWLQRPRTSEDLHQGVRRISKLMNWRTR